MYQRQFNCTCSDKTQIGTIPARFEKLAAQLFTRRHKHCVAGKETCDIRNTRDSFQETISAASKRAHTNGYTSPTEDCSAVTWKRTNCGAATSYSVWELAWVWMGSLGEAIRGGLHGS